MECSRLKEGVFVPNLHTSRGETDSHKHNCSIWPAPILH